MAVAEKTQPATPSGSKYVDFDEFIEYQLRKTRNGIHHTDLLAAGIVLTCLVLGYLLVFTLFDHWVVAGGFSWIARVSLLAGLVITVVGLGIWKLLIPYLRHINTLYAAREIERAHPELKNSLVSLIDLRRIGREVSPSILKALEKRAATEMSHADLEQAVDRKTLMRASYALLAIVVLMGAYTLISPKKLSTSIWRALFPTSSVAVSTTTQILQVTPGNTEVLARSQIDVTVDLGGKIPEEVSLIFSTSDRRFVDETIVMRNTGEDLPRYRARLTGEQGAGLLSDIAYRIVAGDAESPTYHIRVNQPPSAAVSETHYEYPDYMLLDNKTSSSANIDAWEGTWITLHAKANMPVTKALLKTSDTEDITLEAEDYPMQVNGTELTCRWQLKFRQEDGTFADYYHIQLWNEKDENDPQPTVHRIKIRPDQKPEINLIHPVSDIEAPANAVIPIVFEARDPDFMLRRVDLKLERAGEILGTSPRLLEAPPYVSETNQTYRLKLEDYLLKPGDQLSFFVEAHDNRALIDGYGDDMTRTSKVTITVIEPQAPEQVKEFEAEQEREAQQRLLEEKPERNERQPRPQQEQKPNQQQPQDGEMGEDGQAGEATSTEDGQPGEKGAQETNDPDAAEGQTTKQSPGNGDQRPQDAMNDGNMPPENRANENSEAGPDEKAEPSDSGQPGQQTKPSGAEKGSQQKRDKAAEDQALRELLEWNKRQQEKEKGQQSNPDSPGNQADKEEPMDPSQPTPNEDSGDNKSNSASDSSTNDPQKSNPPADPNQSKQEDGATGSSNMSEDSQEGETSSESDSQNKSSNTSQSNSNKPEQANDPNQNSPDKTQSEGTPSGMGQGSDSMNDKGNEQAKPGEVGPDAKSEPGNKPPSENMKEGTGEGEKTRQPADPDTQPGERTERGDPSENAKQKNSDNNKPQEDSQKSPSQNQSDQNQNMKGNDSAADSQQQSSNDNKSNPSNSKSSDQKADPSSSDSSQSKGEPGSQSPGNSDQKSSQSDSNQTSDSKNSDSKSPNNSSQDSQSAESKSNDGNSSDQKNSSPSDNSMKESGQDSKNSDTQQSSSESGKGSQQNNPDSQNQSDSKESGSKPQNQSDSDSKQNGGQQGEQSSKSQDGNQQGNQKGGDQQGKQKGGDQQGNQSGSPSDAQSSQPGKQMGEGSNAPSNPSTQSGGGTGRAEGASAGPGSGEGVGAEAEAADLESKKKATSLALKRLQQQLERGEAPKELMDDLGYNEEDLDKFMQRLEQRLSDTAETPESEASQRQFESLLKGIDYESRGETRKGNNTGEAAQGFGAGNRPVPPEFRLEQEAYKRKLSRQSTKNN